MDGNNNVNKQQKNGSSNGQRWTQFRPHKWETGKTFNVLTCL